MSLKDWKSLRFDALQMKIVLQALVEADIPGMHPSVRLSHAVEFEQLQEYVPGMDVSRIDWKLFLRRRRLWVKMSVYESRVQLHLVLDTSASMNYSEADRSKWAYAQLLAALLAHIALRQGDACRIWYAASPLAWHATPCLQSTTELVHYLTMDSSSRANLKNNTTALPRGKHIWMLVSDLYSESNEWQKRIRQLRSMGGEVMLWHIMGRQEIEGNWRGLVSFRDLETGRRLRLDASAYRQRYRQKMNAFLAACKENVLACGAAYKLVLLQSAVEQEVVKGLAKSIGQRTLTNRKN